MRIGEVAEAVGVPTATIRFYERKGLLPQPRRGPNGYTVADVGSLNGTYVNRDRIDEVALQGGDEVQIGKYRLVYFASHQGAGTPQ